MRRFLRSFLLALTGLLFVGAANGCSYVYTIHVSGLVQNVTAEAPVPGVTVKVMADEAFRDENAPPIVTDQEGKFQAAFKVSESAFRGNELPKWYLILSRKGYQDQKLDISLKQKPGDPGQIIELNVKGLLKAK